MKSLFWRHLKRRSRIAKIKRGDYDPEEIRKANRLMAEAAEKYSHYGCIGHVSHEPQYFDLDWTFPNLDESWNQKKRR